MRVKTKSRPSLYPLSVFIYLPLICLNSLTNACTAGDQRFTISNIRRVLLQHLSLSTQRKEREASDRELREMHVSLLDALLNLVPDNYTLLPKGSAPEFSFRWTYRF